MKLELNLKRGFSLVEVMTSLLIVSMIAIASVPIITKKKKKVDNRSNGTWICTKESGIYKAIINMKGQESTKTGGSG